jgi:hypothetical protein
LRKSRLKNFFSAGISVIGSGYTDMVKLWHIPQAMDQMPDYRPA